MGQATLFKVMDRLKTRKDPLAMRKAEKWGRLDLQEMKGR